MKVKFGLYDIASGQQRGAEEAPFDQVTITEWRVSVGDKVSSGQPLADIQLDKGESELESPVSGTIIEIREKYAKPGSEWHRALGTESLPNGQTLFLPHLGVIETEDISEVPEQVPSGTESGEAEGSQEEITEEGLASEKPDASQKEITGVELQGRFTPVAWRLLHSMGLNPTDIAATFPDERKIGRDRILEFKAQLDHAQEGGPIAVQDARRLAREQGLSLADIKGSGLNGLILRSDVEEYIRQRETGAVAGDLPEESDRVPLNATVLRKTIAYFLKRSHEEIVKAGDAVEIKVSKLWDFREKYKRIWKLTTGTTLRFDYVFSYIAMRLMSAEFKIVNAYWDQDEEEGYIFKNVNLGIAVNKKPTEQDPFGALIVPVIHNADSMSFLELAKAAEDKIARVQSGKIKLPELRDLTFTINNVGGVGGLDPDSLVPYTKESGGRERPTGMILIIAAVTVREGARYMKLAFSFDHRLFDGAPAINFVNAIKSYIEGIEKPEDFVEELLGPDSSLLKQ